ncbi:MAG: branched-chain amino acid transaminase [Myxococcales bacterium]
MAQTVSGAPVKKTDKIWFDGGFVPWDEAKVHVLCSGLHYGFGVYEGIRAYQCADGRSAVFRLADHLRRFADSTRILMLDLPYSREQLFECCLEILKVNRMKSAYLRPLAFMGEGGMGLDAINPVRVAIIAWEWGSYLGEEGLRRGIRAKVSSFTRMHVNASLMRGKITGQYVNSALAKREAKLAGYDEAILLDSNGWVAEASAENIFIVRDSVVYTPPLSSPVLEGITRHSVLRILRDAGKEVREVPFTRDTMYLADEIFLCGTAAEITPVREVDDRKIGDGTVGPVTRMVQETYLRATRGEEPKYKEWLTYF